MLNGPLSQIEKAAGGPGKIPKLIGKNYIYVSRDEMEYNDIAFHSRSPEFNRVALTRQEILAVSICWKAKTVRDDLSHLRCPNVEDVAELISNVDALFPEIPLFHPPTK